MNAKNENFLKNPRGASDDTCQSISGNNYNGICCEVSKPHNRGVTKMKGPQFAYLFVLYLFVLCSFVEKIEGVLNEFFVNNKSLTM